MQSSALTAALRSKFRSPQEVLRKLGLDESSIRERDDLADLVRKLRSLSEEDRMRLRELLDAGGEDEESPAELEARAATSPEIVHPVARAEDEPPQFPGRPRPGGAMDTSFAAACAEVRRVLPTLALDSIRAGESEISRVESVYAAGLRALSGDVRLGAHRSYRSAFRAVAADSVGSRSFREMFGVKARVSAYNDVGSSQAVAASAIGGTKSFFDFYPDARGVRHG